ncbi:ybeQ, partial [Symbiodinium sp. KB8]
LVYLELQFKDSLLSCLTNTSPWHSQLATEGDADAQLALALQLEQHRTPKPSLGGKAADEEVLSWLRAAATQGHAEAQALLGQRLKGDDAMRWLHDAALQGDRTGQRALAVALLQSENQAEAQKWLRRAADEGDLEAIDLLVTCLAA